jgi:class 3 adenylate cyclase
LSQTPSHLTEKIQQACPSLEGERTRVTDRDPEEACHLLDPVLTLMMLAVHGYEGPVNRVMGDGIMALLGRR